MHINFQIYTKILPSYFCLKYNTNIEAYKIMLLIFYNVNTHKALIQTKNTIGAVQFCTCLFSAKFPPH